MTPRTSTAPQPTGPDATTEAYAEEQERVNARKTHDFLLPLIRRTESHRVLDVGCGVGTMVRALLEEGFDAYGSDLPGLERFWSRNSRARDRFAAVDALNMKLPFADGSVDFAYTFGVIEHVGTTDGHADRRPDHHEIRRRWLREIWRTVRPGGHLLVAGPNRTFPVDVAHGPDSRASRFGKWFASRYGATLHATWGENFLWSYGDVRRYLDGLPYELEALNPGAYIGYSRVPSAVRLLVKAYVASIPTALLDSGLNPWVMALLRKS